MKNILFLVVIGLYITACKRNSGNDNNSSGDLLGKWQLTEFLADPGDGSGTWQKADPTHPGFIEFKSDSTVTISGASRLPSVNYFQRLNDSVMLFVKSNKDSTRLGYHLSGNTLSINPPCYEACGSHYVRVN